MSAQDEQLEAVLRSVEAFDSPALSGDAFAQAKVGAVLEANRRAEDAVIDRSTRLSAAIADAVAAHDPGNPDHQSAPFVVFAADLNKRYVCRAPLLLANLVAGFTCEWVTRCDWHGGSPAPSNAGLRQWSLLSVARGQFLVVFAVCSQCREGLQSDTQRYQDGDDATLRDVDGLEGARSVEWHRFPSVDTDNLLDVSVAWHGLQWTLPLEVTQSPNPVADPRAWGPNPN